LLDYLFTIDYIKIATSEKLEVIDEIGPSISNSVVQYFLKNENIILINELKNKGLKFATEVTENSNQNLSGLSFVVTGALSKITRDEAKERIIASGGKFLSSLTKKTDYLIAGENAGSKLEKAKKLGVKIISEVEFNGLLNK